MFIVTERGHMSVNLAEKCQLLKRQLSSIHLFLLLEIKYKITDSN